MSISDFADLFASTITHSAFASRDEYGMVTYGSPATYNARIINKPKTVSGKDEQEIVSNTQVWIEGNPNIDTDDQIELPDGSTPRILTVERISDESGWHHTKVYLG